MPNVPYPYRGSRGTIYGYLASLFLTTPKVGFNYLVVAPGSKNKVYYYKTWTGAWKAFCRFNGYPLTMTIHDEYPDAVLAVQQEEEEDEPPQE